jgi:hypothetical protein
VSLHLLVSSPTLFKCVHLLLIILVGCWLMFYP